MKAWDKGFIHGYCCAVANIMRTHDESVVAIDVLNGGVSLEDAKRANVDQSDMEILMPLFNEMNRPKKKS